VPLLSPLPVLQNGGSHTNGFAVNGNGARTNGFPNGFGPHPEEQESDLNMIDTFPDQESDESPPYLPAIKPSAPPMPGSHEDFAI
jgi:hypothetical protein